MASNTVQAKIDLLKGKDETSDAKNSIESFGKSVTATKGFLESFTDSLKRVGEIAAAIGIEKLTEKIVELGKQSVEFGMDAANSFEQVKTQLDVLTGSAEKSSLLLNDIAQFEPNTSFDFNQLAGWSEQIRNYGTANEQVVPQLKMFSDVSLGNAESMTHLVNAMGEAEAQGKVTSLTLNMLSKGAKIPALPLLTEYLNKNATAMTSAGTATEGTSKKQKEAATDIAHVTAEINTQNQWLKEHANNHKTAQSSIMGHQESLRKLNEKLSQDQALLGKGTGAVKAFGQAHKLTQQQVQDMISSGEVKYEDMMGALTMSTEKGGMFFEAMKHHMNTFQGIMSSTKTQFQQMALTILGFDMSQINKDGTENKHFGELNDGAIFQGIKDGAQTFLKFLTQHKKDIEDFAKQAQSYVMRVSDTVIKVAMYLKNAFAPAWADIQKGFSDFVDYIVQHKAVIEQFGKDTVDTLTRIFTFIVKEGIPAIKKLWDIIVQLGDHIKTAFVPVWNHLLEIYNKHKETINNLALIIGGVLYGAFTIIIYTVAKVIDIFLSLVDMAMTKFGPTINWIADIVKQLGTSWDSVIKDMNDNFTLLVNGVIDGVNLIIEAFNKLTNLKVPNIGHIGLGTSVEQPSYLSQGVTSSPAMNYTPALNYTPVSSNSSKNVSITNNNNFSSNADMNAFAKYQAFQINGSYH